MMKRLESIVPVLETYWRRSVCSCLRREVHRGMCLDPLCVSPITRGCYRREEKKGGVWFNDILENESGRA